MNSICFILPYFGTFPQYIDAFLSSCKENPEYDFLILTDAKKKITANNIRVIPMTFPECQALIKNRLNYLGFNNVCINKPYKLCDYKPCYGHIFSEYIKDYKYWGHIDCDLILGRIAHFLRNINIEEYDRIFKYGHLSIYKNTEEVNKRFLKNINYCDFRTSSKTTLATHYDELGINYIYNQYKYPFYKENFSVTISLNEFSYKSGVPELVEFPQLFVKYPNGKIIFYYLDKSNTIHKSEILYLHFMSRKDVVIDIDINKPYLLTPYGAIIFDEKLLLEYFKTYGNLDSRSFRKNNKRALIKKRLKTLIDEIKYNKIKAIKYYYNHIKPSPFTNWY